MVSSHAGTGVPEPGTLGVLLRLPSRRPQKGRQAVRLVGGAEAWAGADEDFARAVAFSPAAFTWVRDRAHLVELPALWARVPLLGKEPAELAEQVEQLLLAERCPLPHFVLVGDGHLAVAWAIEPLRRPRAVLSGLSDEERNKREMHHATFLARIEDWKKAAIKLSLALAPAGAVPLDLPTAEELLLSFLPLPVRPGTALENALGMFDDLPQALTVRAEPLIRIADVSRPLRRFDAALFEAIGAKRPSKAAAAYLRSRRSQDALLPHAPGSRHIAAVDIACACVWDGLEPEQTLGKLRGWASSCTNDGKFPFRSGGKDELELIARWAHAKLSPGGPDSKRSGPQVKKRASRDAVADAVTGFLAANGGLFSGSKLALAKQAALFALAAGAKTLCARSTLRRALSELKAAGSVVHETARVGRSLLSTFRLVQPGEPGPSSGGPAGPSSGGPSGSAGSPPSAPSASATAPLQVTASQVTGPSPAPPLEPSPARGPSQTPSAAIVVVADLRLSRVQKRESIWAPGFSGPVSQFRGGDFGGSLPPEGGVQGGIFPPFDLASESTAVDASPPGAPGVGGDQPTAGIAAASSPRQRRLPLPRVNRPKAKRSKARAGLPPLTDALIDALFDVAPRLSRAARAELLRGAWEGLRPRPAVLADFEGALRSRALRLHVRALKKAQSDAYVAAADRANSTATPADQATATDHLDSTTPAHRLHGRHVVPEATEGLVGLLSSIAAVPFHKRPVLERARVLHNKGLSLAALLPRSKEAASEWKAHQVTQSPLPLLQAELEGLGHEAGLAIICGDVSGIVCCDFDDAAGVLWAERNLPKTPWRTKTARGEHWFYRLDGAWVPPDQELAWKGELRGNGQYVVAPGSTHETGVVYEAMGDWRVGRDALPVWRHSHLVDVEALRRERALILKRDQ